MSTVIHRIVVGLAAAVLCAGTVLTVRVAAQKPGSVADNKALAQRFHLDMIGKGQLDIADSIIGPECLFHLPGGTRGKGPARAKELAQGDLKQYPKGIKLAHNVVLAENNLVAFQWDLWGTKESGEVEHLQGIDVVKIENGKAAEMWIEYHTPKNP
jgi:hypothetical protein